jgi:hypothetical protein
VVQTDRGVHALYKDSSKLISLCIGSENAFLKINFNLVVSRLEVFLLECGVLYGGFRRRQDIAIFSQLEKGALSRSTVVENE